MSERVWSEHVGVRLRMALAERDPALLSDAGFSPMDVNDWLACRRWPSDIQVLAMADLLGVRFAWLRAGEGPRLPAEPSHV